MDKIKITSEDVAQIFVPSSTPARPQEEQRKDRLIPVWLRILSSFLVLFPPLLYLVTLAVLSTMRKRPMALKHAWAVHLCCLLVASGILLLVIGLVIVLAGPGPAAPDQSAALAISKFPTVPAVSQLSAKDIAQELRPLVLVVHSQPPRFRFPRNTLFPSRVGAAAVIYADTDSCLAVTSRHVVQPSFKGARLGQSVIVADEHGTWVPGRLVGRHRELDLALISFARATTTNAFTQPIRAFSSIALGDDIFAIGHPEGLEFSISTGIISQKRGNDLLQVSAPVSPGSSGGPIYDRHGALLGIVQSVIDKQVSPNAENLNFAVRADALLDSTAWVLDETGSRAMAAIAAAASQPSVLPKEPTQPEMLEQ